MKMTMSKNQIQYQLQKLNAKIASLRLCGEMM